MKHTLRKAVLILTMLCLAVCAHGCQKERQVLFCPFTDITWENSLSDIQSIAGELIETRDSIYNGKSYLYAKDYKGYDGTVYYIFDDKEALVSMAWGYSGASSEEINSLHDEIYKELVKTHGESDYSPQFGGNVWYTDGGNIVLFSIDTEEYKALQLNYVHPDAAEKE